MSPSFKCEAFTVLLCQSDEGNVAIDSLAIIIVKNRGKKLSQCQIKTTEKA